MSVSYLALKVHTRRETLASALQGPSLRSGSNARR